VKNCHGAPCVLLHVNCFYDDENQNNLNSVAEQLEQVTTKREALLSAARLNEDGISLYAEGETRRSISTMNLRAALQTFLELQNPHSYIGIIPFFQLTREYADARPHGLCARNACSSIYRTAFSSSLQPPAEDVAIPGADYTFGDLQRALALAEFEALGRAQKHTIRVHLSELGEKSLKQLADVVIQAVTQIQRVTQAMRD
jgi:hypothetical protein